jgi:hypothetical protein
MESILLLKANPRLLPLILIAAPLLHAEISVSLEPSVPSPVPVGTMVTWRASVSDSSAGTHWFRFSTRGFDRPRRIVKDFGPDTSFDWAAGEHEGFYVIEVEARNRQTGETAAAVESYDVRSNVIGGAPAIHPTVHPLVMLYSAPACPPTAKMTVFFVSPGNRQENTPAKDCDGIFSMNFHIAGLRPNTYYEVQHLVVDGDETAVGPVLSFVSGQVEADLPSHWAAIGSPMSRAEPVMLAGSLQTHFVATDLAGNLIWYYPKLMLFLTHPEPGGYFFGVHEDDQGDQSRQILRLFDLTGTTVLETNAARVNEQLAAMGKRPINAFHHEARFLSNGNIVVLAGVEQILENVQGEGRVNVLGDMIVVLNRDLEVVWTWDAFDHLDPRRVATQGDTCTPAACPPLFLAPAANDWTHGNAITETPDGNLLLSLRSQDWVLKIDYSHGTGNGEVLWRLGEGGDFSIRSTDPNPWFSHQHDAEYEDDGTITLFDNSNVRRAADPNAHSRGQVFRLDEQNRVAELVMNADLGVYAFALGSAEKLEDGNYFFDAGFRENGTGISVETDPTGTIQYGIESTAPEYRTFRMKSMYNQ